VAETHSDNLITLRALAVHFPVLGGLLRRRQIGTVHAVDGVDLDIRRGETLGLVGESGCGKSTLGRAVLQLVRPTGGEVRFDGTELTGLNEDELRPLRRRMQMVFQDPFSSLNPRMSVGETVAEPMLVHGLAATAAERREKTAELFRIVGLSPEMLDRYPHEFSGGQRQRIGIARALAAEPDFIVCDEPVSALDVSIQAQIVNLFEDLRHRLGLTYLFIAHDLAVVRHLSDRIAVMYLGRIVEIAPKVSLYAEPLHPYTQALLSAVPVPDRAVERRRQRIVLQGEVPSPLDPPRGCHFHPRCAHAFAPCTLKQPPLREIKPGHYTACHLYDEQAMSTNPDSPASTPIEMQLRQTAGLRELPTLAEAIARPFGTLSDFVRIHAGLRPNHVAVIQGERQILWRDFDTLIDRAAATLQDRGVGVQEAIAICAANSIEYLVTFLGALRAGVTVAPLAPNANADSLDLMLRDSGAKILFLDAAVSSLLSSLPDPATVSRVALDSSDAGAGFDNWLLPNRTTPRRIDVAPSSTFNIIYSSGTTGVPKGIAQPHALRWLQMIPENPPGYGPDAISLVSTGLYSNTTLTSVIPTLSGGGTLVLMEKFDALRFLELSERDRVTHAMLVPVQYQRLLALPEFGRFDLSSYVMKFCTSAPFSAALKRDVLDRWPGGLTEYYGMTEGGGSCWLLAHQQPDKLHTVGQPIPGHDIRVIGEDGRELPAGETGEIVGHSGAIMTGYHNQPVKTSEVEWLSPDGRRFIRTGDVGRFDEDGFLILMDRKKDMIISGGFNIYPSDLEAAVRQHPDVQDVAVVGVPSEKWGETPVAFVVSMGASAEDIKTFVNARVGKTQRLADVRLTAQLPRSHIGKVLKRELRDSYLDGSQS
jgi:long-chain acyl-CoA synthetase